MARRTGWLIPLAFAAVAATTCAAVAGGAGLASTQDTPGLAAMPPGAAHYLQAPAAAAGGVPTVIDRPGPSMLSCHRWPEGPLTQTFDPSSPACIAGWDAAKGNGGSTSRGVEKNIIKVGVAHSSPDLKALVAFFNANYQFYGRSIELVEIGSFGTPATQNAAVAAAAERGVFAATDVDAAGNVPPDAGSYLTELAKRRIVGVTGWTGVTSDAVLTGNGPYPWSWGKSRESRLRELATFVCRSLASSPARQAGRPTGRARTFAILTPAAADAPSQRVDPSSLVAGLRGCGIDAPVREYQDGGFTDDPALPAADKAMHRRLKEDGVSTVLFVGPPGDLTDAQGASAESVGFRPEWVGDDFSANGAWQLMGREQAVNVIGLSEASDVDLGASDLPTAATLAGGADPSPTAEWRQRRSPLPYRTLSLLAAGIQAAGPRLTPETFAAGLESADFPGPAARRPYFAPRVGLQFGDHMFRRDLLLGRPVFTRLGYSQPFVWCLAGRGQRYGHTVPFPTSDAFLYDPKAGC